MSSREPLWFCHECNAEMRPLMVPNPVCASCHGSFVEKIENTEDDPRAFHTAGPGLGIADFDDAVPPGVDTFLLGLQSLLDRGMTDRPRSPRQGSGLRFEFHTGTGALRGADNRNAGDVPTMSEFIDRRTGANRGSGSDAPGQDPTRATITGPLMAQYLLALLGGRGGPEANFLSGAAEGRMGDYVFGQEALDEIITQLMENSNAHRPVPAPEDIIAKLPKEILEANSPLLEKDCAVCKDQFKLDTEDPDEQVVVTLPCKHPFHEPCIMPWLKSSGTCPVCRHALVPQPDSHASDASTPASSSPASGGGRSPRASSTSRTYSPSAVQPDNGFFQSLFNSFAGNPRESPLRNSSSSNSRLNRSSSDPSQGSSNRRSGDSGSGSNNPHIPGSWSEDLD